MFEKRKDGSAEDPVQSSINETPPEDRSPGSFNTRSAAVIGSTIKIKGSITGGENLVIEGQVEGSVKLSGHDLTVGQAGEVDADLEAKTVKIEGRITGDIKGAEKVIVTRSGRVLGNITAPRVTLEDGAKFKGSIDMDPDIDKPAVAAVPKRPSTTSKPDASEGKDARSGV